MRAKSKLIDIIPLRELIKGLGDFTHPQHRECLNARWLNYVQWWDSRAAAAKWKYFSLRSTVVIGSALLPALVSLQQLQGLEHQKTALAVASIVVSLLVAIAGAIEGLFNFGEVWRHKRDAAELIKSEGFRYFQLIGPYAGATHATAYPKFAENVEKLIRQEIKEYVAIVAEAPGPPAPDKQAAGTPAAPAVAS